MSAGWTDDLYFKKRLSYTLNRQQFYFDAAELLFSTFEIDIGTQFLLRNLLINPQSKLIESPRLMLDLGCGYGVIGIVLAKFYPQAQVLLSDKDLLAVRYTAHNITLNEVSNAAVVGSVGIEDLPRQPFDLILSNVPGHIGEQAIEQDFVLGPLSLLSPGGAYWLVIVTPLADLIESVARQHELPCEEVARRPGHVLFKLGKAAEISA